MDGEFTTKLQTASLSTAEQTLNTLESMAAKEQVFQQQMITLLAKELPGLRQAVDSLKTLGNFGFSIGKVNMDEAAVLRKARKDARKEEMRQMDAEFDESIKNVPVEDRGTFIKDYEKNKANIKKQNRFKDELAGRLDTVAPENKKVVAEKYNNMSTIQDMIESGNYTDSAVTLLKMKKDSINADQFDKLVEANWNAAFENVLKKEGVKTPKKDSKNFVEPSSPQKLDLSSLSSSNAPFMAKSNSQKDIKNASSSSDMQIPVTLYISPDAAGQLTRVGVQLINS
jgi:hypothetical protein